MPRKKSARPAASGPGPGPLLQVEDLRTVFPVESGGNGVSGEARAVDGVSFSIDPGETLALVGESACGKSVTALSIMRLVQPPGHHPGGRIIFEGRDLLRADHDTLRSIRGNRISMIFQEPMTSLNPVYTIGNQLAEPLLLHQKMTAAQARAKSLELLEHLGIAAPDMILGSYPHQLSGGMRQRVMIAMAIACRPRLMIADEPTTALDVTVQAQILHLIRELQLEIGMSLLLITHDLGVVNQMSDRICVMYSGRVAETGDRERLLRSPSHPYTVKLLRSIPRGADRNTRLSVIRGQVRSAASYSAGCRFAERCDHAGPRCMKEQPPLFGLPRGGSSACFLVDPENPLEHQIRAPEEPEAASGKDAGANAGLLLETVSLSTHFPVRKGFFQRVVGHVKAVDGVSLAIREGTTLGLVGESGCGKTTLGHSLLNLEGHARGEVMFEGHNLLALSGEELRAMRHKVQIIFQDPFASLNPRLTIGEIVGEGLRVHQPGLSREQATERLRQVLEEVGLPPGIQDNYAHEFSGGQRQRI
ncbi:MAG: dipeptide ABC transporter ATP-binding protein, partial [Deltaproteobacteria bacterium]|nr:dipeptide ABC transporter ATP-binding protein [Deltaproteobacteria bacterium]